MLQLDSILPIETSQLISTDTFIYSIRQTTATRVPVDSSLTESLFTQTLYDDKYRVTNDITICKFNNSPNDTLEKKYAYKHNKMTCLIKTHDIILTDLTRLNTDEIRTEYYNDSGLILKITNLRVRLNLTDSLLFKYEFY